MPAVHEIHAGGKGVNARVLERRETVQIHQFGNHRVMDGRNEMLRTGQPAPGIDDKAQRGAEEGALQGGAEQSRRDALSHHVPDEYVHRGRRIWNETVEIAVDRIGGDGDGLQRKLLADAGRLLQQQRALYPRRDFHLRVAHRRKGALPFPALDVFTVIPGEAFPAGSAHEGGSDEGEGHGHRVAGPRRAGEGARGCGDSQARGKGRREKRGCPVVETGRQEDEQGPGRGGRGAEGEGVGEREQGIKGYRKGENEVVQETREHGVRRPCRGGRGGRGGGAEKAERKEGGQEGKRKSGEGGNPGTVRKG